MYRFEDRYPNYTPIPEGYTYERCDLYTRKQFIERFGPLSGDECSSWCDEHPKELYDTDDQIEYMRWSDNRSLDDKWEYRRNRNEIQSAEATSNAPPKPAERPNWFGSFGNHK